MTDTVSSPSPPSTISSVINSIMQGIESGIFAVVLSVLATFMPQLVSLTSNDLLTVGNNFRQFLAAIGSGQTWGAALADMMTADWNAVEDSAKQAAIDFAEAVATALENLDLLPQGK